MTGTAVLPHVRASRLASEIDLADLADPRLASIIRRLPRLLTRFRKLKLFICGLPGSPGEKSLALTSLSSSEDTLAVLDAVIRDLANETRSDAIVYKEFGNGDLEWTRPLLTLGYRRISIPPMHFFKPSFQDFDEYRAALRTRYRQEVNRSIRKLKAPGIRQEILTDSRRYRGFIQRTSMTCIARWPPRPRPSLKSFRSNFSAN
jgi:hypothetical protein